MAQRTEAIYNGKSIGIESIYTVIGDKQINIPEKLNWLREKEAAESEKRRAREEFARNMAAGFEQQENPIKDPDGNRWVKCEFCGKIAMDSEFSSYGGKNHVNLGTCIECSRNNPKAAVQISIPHRGSNANRYDPTVCPECGSRLVERNGRNGRFVGCSSYPRCKYTRSIR